MTTDNFCFYLQNRLIQTSQTGRPLYNNTSPFSIPCFRVVPQVVSLAKHCLMSRLSRPSSTLGDLICVCKHKLFFTNFLSVTKFYCSRFMVKKLLTINLLRLNKISILPQLKSVNEVKNDKCCKNCKCPIKVIKTSKFRKKW